MKFVDLFVKPILPILSKAIDVDLNLKKLALFILYLLGDKSKDETTARMLDDSIEGGAAVEAIDGLIILSYIRKLRAWAEEKSKE